MEVSIGARHRDVTCSLCFGHLWLSVMVSVCRLALSTGHLISGLLNKNPLVELFDHMVEPTRFLPTLHTGFFLVLPNSGHLSGELTILRGARSYSHQF